METSVRNGLIYLISFLNQNIDRNETKELSEKWQVTLQNVLSILKGKHNSELQLRGEKSVSSFTLCRSFIQKQVNNLRALLSTKQRSQRVIS